MSNKIKQIRLPIELKQLETNQAQHGISCTRSGSDDYSELLAYIPGPQGTPYEGGTFEVSISVGTHYPFQPPNFKFQTPIWHPNIDRAGKICLDLLRMPPTGSYNPAITLESILLSIQLLLANPNPDDPLQAEAADLYKTNRELYNSTARRWVQKHCLNQSATNEPKKSTDSEDQDSGKKRLRLT